MQVGEILNETVSSAQPDIGNAELARGSPETDLQAHGLTEFEKTVRFLYLFSFHFVYVCPYSLFRQFMMDPKCIIAVLLNNAD